MASRRRLRKIKRDEGQESPLKLLLLCSVPQAFLSLPWTSCIVQHEGLFLCSCRAQGFGTPKASHSWAPRATLTSLGRQYPGQYGAFNGAALQ